MDEDFYFTGVGIIGIVCYVNSIVLLIVCVVPLSLGDGADRGLFLIAMAFATMSCIIKAYMKRWLADYKHRCANFEK